MNKCNLDYKRVLNKGKSFECSKWQPFITYTNDCIKQDFVTIDGALFVCIQTHLSSEDNKPKLVYGDPINPHEPTGSSSPYWEYVLSGFSDWDKLSEDVQKQIIENIDGLDTPDTEVLGEYVSSVMQEDGKLKIKRTALPTSKVFSENEFFDINIEQSKGGLSKLNVNIKDIAKQTDFEQLKNTVDNLEPVPSLTEITYNNLRILRNNGKLIPGTWYRITDYQTTTNKANTQAAGHQFDVIVLATDNNNLSHCARAIQHEGDTYFKNSNLNAWQLWYDLDNDVLKYDWANSSGKGVIYRMIDEYNNDIPYDFKNIMFTAYYEPETYTGYYYTFSGLNGDEILDASVNPYPYTTIDTQNVIIYAGVENNTNANVLKINLFIFPENVLREANNIVIGYNSYSNTFIGPHSTVYLSHGCRRNVFINKQESVDASNIYLNAYCDDNKFLDGGFQVILGYNCNENIFMNRAYDVEFGYGCNNNVFRKNVNDLKLGYGSSKNQIGTCNRCTIQTYMRDNIFEQLIICKIGASFQNNVGNILAQGTIGNFCQNNNFGNYRFFDFTLGEKFQNNIFNIECIGLTTGHNVGYNSFIINAEISDTPTLGYSRIESYTRYNNFVLSENTPVVKNHKIFVKGSEDNYNNIEFEVTDNDYQVNITQNSSGEIKQYCEADLIA